MPGIRDLRAIAVGASLRIHASLADAVQALQFVQYDPIRRPACAQDLILHQRVRGYHSGDLNRQYAQLGMEEAYLHVYGAMTQRLANSVRPGSDRGYSPRGLAAEVLAAVRERGPMLPRDLTVLFGRARETNDWGGVSAATTRALEELHQHWLVRVAYRTNGFKVYETCPSPPEVPGRKERARRLALHLADSLAPISDSSLLKTLAQLERATGITLDRAAVINDLVESGELTAAVVDGIRYLWPTGESENRTINRVRFLAPFDPVVWDRRRFEHLWGWAYRFEAYTPAAKRQFGYYALPMFWADQAIGWVTCDQKAGWSLTTNFIGTPPTSKTFRQAFDRETSRLADMLGTAVHTVSYSK